MKTRAVSKPLFRNYLKKAEEYFDAMNDEFSNQRWNSCVLNAIHCGISAADALTNATETAILLSEEISTTSRNRNEWNFSLYYDATNDEIRIRAPAFNIEGSVAGWNQTDVRASKTDKYTRYYVDEWGTLVTYDSNNKNDVVIEYPDEQVQGRVYVTNDGLTHQTELTGLTDGQHTVDLLCTDLGGNSSSASIVFGVNTTPIIPTNITCSDTDGGVYEFINGECDDGVYYLGISDYCVNSNTLREFYCDENSMCQQQNIICTNGCENGVCITNNNPPTSIITSPTDNSAFTNGTWINFTGLVYDLGDQNTSLSVVWSSDIDGILATNSPDEGGNTGFATNALSINMHTITPNITDSGGLSAADLYHL